MTTPRIKLIWIYDKGKWKIDIWDSHGAPLSQRQKAEIGRLAREIHRVLTEEGNDDTTRQPIARTGHLPLL